MKARLTLTVLVLLIAGISAETARARCSEADYSFFEGCVQAMEESEGAIARVEELKKKYSYSEKDATKDPEVQRYIALADRLEQCMSFSKNQTKWASCAERWIDIAIDKSAQEQFGAMTPEEQQILEKLGGMEKMKEIVKENIMAREDIQAIFKPDF